MVQVMHIRGEPLRLRCTRARKLCKLYHSPLEQSVVQAKGLLSTMLQL